MFSYSLKVDGRPVSSVQVGSVPQPQTASACECLLPQNVRGHSVCNAIILIRDIGASRALTAYSRSVQHPVQYATRHCASWRLPPKRSRILVWRKRSPFGGGWPRSEFRVHLSTALCTYAGHSFNKRMEDFQDLRAYNDYLEEVEEMGLSTILSIFPTLTPPQPLISSTTSTSPKLKPASHATNARMRRSSSSTSSARKNTRGTSRSRRRQSGRSANSALRNCDASRRRSVTSARKGDKSSLTNSRRVPRTPRSSSHARAPRHRNAHLRAPHTRSRARPSSYAHARRRQRRCRMYHTSRCRTTGMRTRTNSHCGATTTTRLARRYGGIVRV